MPGFRIQAVHFVGGGTYVQDHNASDVLRVKKCAPIIKYMVGWSKQQVISRCTYKGWQYEDTKEDI